jgi:pyruvate kinase
VKTARRSALIWGVTSVVTSETDLATIRDVLVSRALVPSGAAVVFVAIRPVLGRDGANFVHVERL